MKIEEAIILAAGLSTRLKARGILTPKFALKVEEAPLIWYPLNSLLQCEVNRFVVVVAEVYQDIANNLFDKYFKQVKVKIVTNKFPCRGNGYSLLLALKNAKADTAYVSMSDHIYPPDMPEKMLEDYIALGEPDILVGGDSKPSYIDIAEATKILADENGNLISIGKQIEKYNYVDVGLLVIKRSALNIIEDLKLKSNNLELSKLLTIAINEGLKVKVSDVTGNLWTEVDTYEDYLSLTRGSRREVLIKFLESLGVTHD